MQTTERRLHPTAQTEQIVLGIGSGIFAAAGLAGLVNPCGQSGGETDESGTPSSSQECTSEDRNKFRILGGVALGVGAVGWTWFGVRATKARDATEQIELPDDGARPMSVRACGSQGTSALQVGIILSESKYHTLQLDDAGKASFDLAQHVRDQRVIPFKVMLGTIVVAEKTAANPSVDCSEVCSHLTSYRWGVRPCRERCETGRVQTDPTVSDEAQTGTHETGSTPSTSTDCDGEQDCLRECETGDSSACARLFALGDANLRGENGPEGMRRAATLFKKACEHDVAEGCNALGFLYGKGQTVSRNFALARQYFAKACELSHNRGHCANAEGATCLANTMTASRRRPALDPYCNPRGGRPGFGPIRAYSPEEPTLRIEGDSCFDAMRTIGCTGVNVATKGESAYCCTP